MAKSISFLFIALTTSLSLATPYGSARTFFESSKPITLKTVAEMGPTLNREGRCVKISHQTESEKRAFVLFFDTGDFGKFGFISFEYFSDHDLDDTLLSQSQFTFKKYWGALYEEKEGLFQKAHDTSFANHLMEYRVGKSIDNKTFLIRKYFADQGVMDRPNRIYIAPFDPIEFCWVELPSRSLKPTWPQIEENP